MKKGDIIDVIIAEQKYPAEGIAWHEGKRIKVQRGLKEQKISVKILKSGSKRMKAKNMEVVERASYEINPPCSFSDFCGGCIFPTVPYDMQLQMKEKEMLDQMKQGEVEIEEYFGFVGCDARTGYRNKMEYTFGDREKGGEMALGMHQMGRHMDIVTVSDCAICHNDFNKIVEVTLDFFVKSNIPFYHKKERTGFQRNLILRRGENTGEILVNLVTTSQHQLNEKQFVEALLSLKLENAIVGINHIINDGIADFVYCDSMKTLYGREYYLESVLGLSFQVSPLSFFQTNTKAAEKLYQEVVQMIEEIEGKTIFDLYCGTGTISQIMARKAKQVIGIEIVEEAIEAAKKNAEINNLKNCHFICGDVFEALDRVKEKPDVIVLDPPRVGVLPKALNKILNYQVKTIVYISCNPLTLAQNLKEMQEQGYQVKRLKGLDNFPGTKHIECVALIEKKDAL